MHSCGLTITEHPSRHRTRKAQPAYVAPPYAPWEFWAHFGVLVLVPIALTFSPYARTGHAKPTRPATSTVGDAFHGRTVWSVCIDAARCEEAER